jgi:hypothetical protein
MAHCLSTHAQGQFYLLFYLYNLSSVRTVKWSFVKCEVSKFSKDIRDSGPSSANFAKKLVFTLFRVVCVIATVHGNLAAEKDEFES